MKNRIDELILDAYSSLAGTSDDEPVSIEQIVGKIDAWSNLDGVDYWKEALKVDVANQKEFVIACRYVRYYSYHEGSDKMGPVDYER